MKKDIFVIVNPAAGGGAALRAEPLVASYLAERGRSAEFVHSRGPEDVREQAAKAAGQGYRYVLALGGDGAFHYVVEGVRGTDAIAGIFPAGNGNDIARDLGIPEDPVRAADAFLRARPREVDLVRARFGGGREAYFIGVGGMGLDAEASYLANTRFKSWPGLARYLAGFSWTFWHEPTFELRVEMEGIRWAGSALLAAVANGTSYGAGLRIAAEAKMDDGWLEVALVSELGWRKVVEAIPVLLTTGDVRIEELQRFRCRRVRLTAERAVKVHGDGEILGDTAAEFEIVPRAIQVMAPEKRDYRR